MRCRSRRCWGRSRPGTQRYRNRRRDGREKGWWVVVVGRGGGVCVCGGGLTRYGKFDTVFDRFSRTSQLCATPHAMPCALLCVLCSVLCWHVLCALCSLLCALCSVLCALCSVLCALRTVLCALRSALCALCSRSSHAHRMLIGACNPMVAHPYMTYPFMSSGPQQGHLEPPARREQ